MGEQRRTIFLRTTHHYKRLSHSCRRYPHSLISSLVHNNYILIRRNCTSSDYRLQTGILPTPTCNSIMNGKYASARLPDSKHSLTAGKSCKREREREREKKSFSLVIHPEKLLPAASFSLPVLRATATLLYANLSFAYCNRHLHHFHIPCK